MKLIEFVPPRPHRLWALCRQMGITDVVVKVAPELTGRPEAWNRDALAGVVGDLAKAGLRVVALEGDPFDMSRVKLGLPGRDETLEHYRLLLDCGFTGAISAGAPNRIDPAVKAAIAEGTVKARPVMVEVERMLSTTPLCLPF